MTADTSPDATPDPAGDDAFARLEKEMSAIRNAIGNLSEQIVDAAADVGTAAPGQARRVAEKTRSHVDSMVSGTSDRAGAAVGAARSRTSSIGGSLQDMIEARPLSSVALALGLGFLIGAIRRR